ncbi:MAG: phosphoribosylformylglycinamidine synthase subunit PurS [Acidobacteriota bacterium]
MKLRVLVSFKKGILEPQGETIRRALLSLGYNSIKDVRQGKFFDIVMDENNKERAFELADEIGRKVLSNPVVESYEVKKIE